ncbi:HAMP domain-containing histidine kinase [Nitratireductor aquimarinus]|uniref:sensor histidine kinase n=1 Tax=Nitratireductor TaxID=245876 RepID=UPI0019D34D5F|nr:MULTISPECIES: HAMP domain-containing sensor histidine kinase [Nitratireductor]MBN7762519.1 HAMP domain-containing histidine kinase [Nitratireductor aquibiodomus]MBN7777682.1 HAMP domain-containing histidine kinase [Nitratireductor pacificus]MBN7781676.1 HAMP domain-containing histidine kinase [Nitratireductor pacificus]MBN7790482.1 HAMP domain-containing histidine kinase [Nitratireductor aquimarinus]MBY6099892.1 HAMP domain-containing histidine kinase [Nitratireductor aquimarinus]
MARILSILNTTAARLSALYLILFAVCASFLVIYMTSLSARMLVGQTRDAINEEVRGLDRSYRRGGLPLLVRVIESRARQPGANLYLLADANGRILSGNVESLQPGVLDVMGWTERPFTYSRFGEGEVRLDPNGSEAKHKAVAVVFRLPNQVIVMVGRDLGEPEKFRSVMQRALVVTLAIMSVGALLIWYFVGRRALKRIDRVSEASRSIMGGDLSHRLPVSSAGDEFDRLSDNLNKMLDRISALNEGLRQVSDNIAHDLKTPLTRLRNRAEAALAGKPETADYRAALERTIAESDQLIRTFNAILMISRLEAGYSAEATGTIDLRAILADVVELYEPLAEEQGVALEAQINGALEMPGNRELIGQALSNIVDNAIKYSAGSGESPAVKVSLDKVGDEIRLTVRDNGPGVSEADRQRVTERFVRLEESRTQPGSGLGLSLAKAVMTFHGGRLEFADNAPGLAVTMVFPAEPPKRKSEAIFKKRDASA